MGLLLWQLCCNGLASGLCGPKKYMEIYCSRLVGDVSLTGFLFVCRKCLCLTS